VKRNLLIGCMLLAGVLPFILVLIMIPAPTTNTQRAVKAENLPNKDRLTPISAELSIGDAHMCVIKDVGTNTEYIIMWARRDGGVAICPISKEMN
jgi:hypothetical protein